MKKKLTLQALARAAQVSQATVSRVVAGNPTVDPLIRKRVRRAAEKLGMDLEDRRKVKSKVIAFLLANRDVLHSFQARILLGAETYCSRHGWELMFMSFHYAPSLPASALHLPQLLSSQTSARAVILGGTNSPNLFQALQEREIPFAVLGNNVIGDWKAERCDVVYSDDIRGAHDATLHLIAKGHTRIGFIGNLQLPWFARCATGYQAAMTESGLTPRCIDVRSDGVELGYLATKTIFAQGPAVTAILAGTDQVAAGVYNALRESSPTRLRDISVVGFNDTQGALFYPPLTTVREFPEELGRHMAEFVLQRLQDPGLPTREITIPTQLVTRDSVHAVARAKPAARRST